MTASQRVLAPVALLTALCALFSSAGAAELEAELGWAGLRHVNFPFDGGVTRVHVRPGDRVSQGAKLIELNPEPIDIRVSQYKAELDAREPVLADAKRDFEHAKSLYEQTVLSDVELQKARHAYEKAAAELAAARARLDFARWQRRQAAATAPFDALVVARDVEPGQMLVAEQRARPLLVLASTDRMVAMARIRPAALPSLSVGASVMVLVENREFAATVVSLGRSAKAGGDDAGYVLAAEFRPEPGQPLWAGQAARIRLP